MSQALFEVPFDPVARLPLLPRKADGSDYTLFDGSPVQGWCLCYDVSDTPPTVTVLVSTSATTMADLKVDTTIAFIADIEVMA